ncbi:SPOR domain-containing protein, partial [Dissulfurirhabdus thermomarina]
PVPPPAPQAEAPGQWLNPPEAPAPGETTASEGEAPAPKTFFTVQIASFPEKDLADKEAARWREKGYRVLVREVFLGPKKGTWYRVYMGRFQTVDEAKRFAEKLAKEKGLKSYIVPLRQ